MSWCGGQPTFLRHFLLQHLAMIRAGREKERMSLSGCLSIHFQAQTEASHCKTSHSTSFPPPAKQKEERTSVLIHCVSALGLCLLHIFISCACAYYFMMLWIIQYTTAFCGNKNKTKRKDKMLKTSSSFSGWPSCVVLPVVYQQWANWTRGV